jgi:pyridoxal phosphate enzyme (YggS family)
LSDSFAERWRQLRRRVDEACMAAGRLPATVTILPVSKTFAPAAIEAAMAEGLRRFGENKAQEIRGKAEALAGRDIDWVMIGHLQTNKAREIARLAAEVQSLDRLELAHELDRRLQQAGRVMDVLIQVKTSPEPSKYGVAPAGLAALLDGLKACASLRPRGLMTMAIESPDPQRVAACFRLLRELRDRQLDRGHRVERLSMGMSGDFPQAIAEGSTEVRVGTALFGGRNYADTRGAGEQGGS